MILIDTDMAVDVLRGHGPAVEWWSGVTAERPVLVGFSAMELLGGCRDKKDLFRVDRFLGDITVLWPFPWTCEAGYRLYHDYRLTLGIGLVDSLIAATAMEYEVPLNSFNKKHFYGIVGLGLVHPYSR